jgi:hypothetical protein
MSKVPQAGRSKLKLSKHSYLSGKGKIVIAGGVAAFVVLGIGVVWMTFSTGSPDALTVSTVRPVETVRYATAPEKGAKNNPTVAPDVQPPQGTVRRMEAIGGAFSKK